MLHWGHETVGRCGQHRVVVLRSSLASSAELHPVDSDTGTARALTEHNRERLAALDLAKAESFVFHGTGGDEVGGMLVRPPAFDATMS